MQVGKHNTFKIVLTGPESSGKTVLSRALAAYFKTAWVPEFARSYLAHLGRPYQQEDLHTIGKGQYAWETWYLQQKQALLVCDTDWTVLQVWEHFRFGMPKNDNWQWAKGYSEPQVADLYLLCVPDFPWQPDPLRENAKERQVLFEWYERLLQTSGATYRTVNGSHKNRLETAISQVAKLLTTLH